MGLKEPYQCITQEMFCQIIKTEFDQPSRSYFSFERNTEKERILLNKGTDMQSAYPDSKYSQFKKSDFFNQKKTKSKRTKKKGEVGAAKDYRKLSN